MCVRCWLSLILIVSSFWWSLILRVIIFIFTKSERSERCELEFKNAAAIKFVWLNKNAAKIKCDNEEVIFEEIYFTTSVPI